MAEQAIAGWYPDGHGAERYWDGYNWTDHRRVPEQVSGDLTVAEPKRLGGFSKFGASVRRGAAERQAEKAERIQKQAEIVHAAGDLVTSGVFGTSTIEIYSGGYVRIASNERSATSPAKIDGKTAYERLHSIKFLHPESVPSAEPNTPFESAIGQTVAGLVQGGKALMKATAPGLAAASLAQITAAKAGKTTLTVVTDKKIHVLTNESSNGLFTVTNREHNEVALALTAAGAAVLGLSSSPEGSPESDPQPSKESDPAPAPQPSPPAQRLRELAELHREGILSDDEFAAGKARLLGEI